MADKCQFCGLPPTVNGEREVTCCRKGDLVLTHGFTSHEAKLIVDDGVAPLVVIRMRRNVRAMARKRVA